VISKRAALFLLVLSFLTVNLAFAAAQRAAPAGRQAGIAGSASVFAARTNRTVWNAASRAVNERLTSRGVPLHPAHPDSFCGFFYRRGTAQEITELWLTNAL